MTPSPTPSPTIPSAITTGATAVITGALDRLFDTAIRGLYASTDVPHDVVGEVVHALLVSDAARTLIASVRGAMDRGVPNLVGFVEHEVERLGASAIAAIRLRLHVVQASSQLTESPTVPADLVPAGVQTHLTAAQVRRLAGMSRAEVDAALGLASTP